MKYARVFFFHYSILFLLLYALLLPTGVSAAMIGSQTSPGAAPSLPADVDAALTALLDSVSGNGGLPEQALLTVLTWARANEQLSGLSLKKRPQGSGVFYHSSLNVPLQRFARYNFNPKIPQEMLCPSSLRHGSWLPGSALLSRPSAVQDLLQSPSKAAPFPVIRGIEQEETAPDASSGSYYRYALHRAISVLSFQDCAAIVSLSRQQKKSDVGRKSLILGDDSNWNYLYSKENGTTMSLAGWADTHIYDSASITILCERSPGAAVTEFYCFKFLNAGWAGMNMVKPRHILKGLQRYAGTLNTLLTSPRLPRAEAMEEENRALHALDVPGLQTRLQPLTAYLNSLQDSKNSQLRSSPFKELLVGDNYVRQLSPEDMRSEYLKLYLKQQLGKALFPAR